jgi:hypothetical protein
MRTTNQNGTINDSDCVCDFGTYRENDKCLPCSQAYPSDYQYRTTITTNSSSSVACQCIPGYTPTSGKCQACKVGTFKSTISNDTCQTCKSVDPNALTTNGAGAIDASNVYATMVIYSTQVVIAHHIVLHVHTIHGKIQLVTLVVLDVQLVGIQLVRHQRMKQNVYVRAVINQAIHRLISHHVRHAIYHIIKQIYQMILACNAPIIHVKLQSLQRQLIPISVYVIVVIIMIHRAPYRVTFALLVHTRPIYLMYLKHYKQHVLNVLMVLHQIPV